MVRWILFEFSKEILLDQKTSNRGIFETTKIENLLNNKEKLSYDFWGKNLDAN